MSDKCIACQRENCKGDLESPVFLALDKVIGYLEMDLPNTCISALLVSEYSWMM
jgi:hypothetical protein